MASVQQHLVRGLAKVFPNALFYKPTNSKLVALTIDDIPTPNETEDDSTNLILDAIANFNQSLPISHVRATFFVISGHLGNRSTILERILEDGHEIGNHGVIDTTHAYLSAVDFETQLHQAHQRLVTPQPTQIRWYRPGRALYHRSMLKAIARLGETEGYEMKLALASVLPLDTYERFDNPQFTSWYMNQFVFPGAILVLHGGSKRRSQNTAKVLQRLLPTITQKGYQIVTLSQLWDEGENLII